MSDDIEFKIARLELRAGDILVLKIKNSPPREALRKWSDHIERISGHRCFVLENGADLDVLTAEEVERRLSDDATAQPS